jgi:hypothetical protein
VQGWQRTLLVDAPLAAAHGQATQGSDRRPLAEILARPINACAGRDQPQPVRQIAPFPAGEPLKKRTGPCGTGRCGIEWVRMARLAAGAAPADELVHGAERAVVVAAQIGVVSRSRWIAATWSRRARWSRAWSDHRAGDRGPAKARAEATPSCRA